MADDKRSRDKQARDAERRQRERETAEELERSDETEPPRETPLDDLESDLAAVEFPATATDLVARVGDRTVDSPSGTYTVEQLLPDADGETFETPAAVTERVERPTVAAALKRIVEASETTGTDLRGSQREAYEKTLRALEAVDAVDGDEGITAITDWIVERIDEKGTLPGSRRVRRQAATFCRANGHEVRDDEWLGI